MERKVINRKHFSFYSLKNWTFSVASIFCAPTFNVLSDCKVRRDYMAVACPYLRLVIVWGCVLNERAVKILGKFFGEKLHK